MGKIGNETEPEEWTEKTESESGGETRMMTTHAGRRRSESETGMMTRRSKSGTGTRRIRRRSGEIESKKKEKKTTLTVGIQRWNGRQTERRSLVKEERLIEKIRKKIQNEREMEIQMEMKIDMEI